MEYRVIRSNRKTVELRIDENAEVIVRAPKSASDADIERIVKKNQKWIDSHIQLQKERQANRKQLSSEEIAELKLKAQVVLPLMTEYYAKKMGVSYNGVKITSAQKRFGSCTGRNSINYSYILMQYPSEAVEYVVVHELAHTVHHNHGKDFYALIEKTLPDYKEREKLLKKIP